MENLALKMKISMLWLLYDVALLAVLIFGLLGPGGIKQVMSGEIGGIKLAPETLFLAALLFLVPLVMAFSSLTLRDLINRWANVVLGVVYTGIQLVALVGSATGNPPAYVMLLEISKTIVPALIVWYAYRWPKEVAQPLLKTPTPVVRETAKV